jgi:hypothetical protein
VSSAEERLSTADDLDKETNVLINSVLDDVIDVRGFDPKQSFCAALSMALVDIESHTCADAGMQTLMDRWEQSDGETWFIAADRLSEFLVARPEAFLRGFMSRPEHFQVWLDSLSGTTFRDFGGTFADRVALRQRMLDALGRVTLPELQESKARALTTIRRTPVTSVN